MLQRDLIAQYFAEYTEYPFDYSQGWVQGEAWQHIFAGFYEQYKEKL